MRKVFVSSVIGGFESYRAVVRSAIVLMGDQAVMVEDFGARPHSSEVACLSEVAQSDIYLLVMGERYGFETEQGISVTQAEFREARASGRPILVFMQAIDMEPKQQEFRQEVEDFASGYFRATFGSETELKDQIIKGLRQYDQAQSAASESDFEARLHEASESMQSMDVPDTNLTISFWPQPSRVIDIVGLEQHLDARFSTLCAQGLASMKNGYEAMLGRNYTGFKSGNTVANYFDDGLLVIKTSPRSVNRTDDFFQSYYVPPSLVIRQAAGAAVLFEGSGAWCQLSLSGMNGKKFSEIPEQQSAGFTFGMSDDEAAFSKCLIPFTSQAYSQWVESSVKRFSRIFSD